MDTRKTRLGVLLGVGKNRYSSQVLGVALLAGFVRR